MFPSWNDWPQYKKPELQIRILEYMAEKGIQSKSTLVYGLFREKFHDPEKFTDLDKKLKMKKENKRTYEKYYPAISVAFDKLVTKQNKKRMKIKMLQFIESKKGITKTEHGEYDSKPQNYFGLTDDSVKWLVNKHSLSPNKFAKLIVTAFNEENNHKLSVSIEKIISDYEKQVLNISREYSSLIFNDYLKRLLKLIKKNKLKPEKSFWKVIELLGRKGTLNEVEIIDSVFKPKNIIQRTNSRTFLNIFVDYGVLFPKIKPITVKPAKILRYDVKYELSPLGVLLFIKYVQKNKKEINLLAKNYQELFPMIFKDSIWSKLKNLKTDVYNLLDTLTKTYFEGSELSPKVSQRRDLSSIFTGYSLIPSKYRREFKELYETSIVVLEEYLQESGYWDKSIEIYSEKFRSLARIGSKDFFINHTPLADSAIYWARSMIMKINRIPPNERKQFEDYIKNPNRRIILSILDFLKQIIWLKDISDPNITTQKLDSTKFYFYDPTAIESVTNTISFHFYILLQENITEKDWREIIVDKKLNDWYTEFLRSINDCVHEIKGDIDKQIMIAKEVIN